MADQEKWYLKDEKSPNLYVWIFRNMAMGAVWAALVLFGGIAILLILYALSYLLPEDPFAALETGTRLLSAVV